MLKEKQFAASQIKKSVRYFPVRVPVILTNMNQGIVPMKIFRKERVK